MCYYEFGEDPQSCGLSQSYSLVCSTLSPLAHVRSPTSLFVYYLLAPFPTPMSSLVHSQPLLNVYPSVLMYSYKMQIVVLFIYYLNYINCIVRHLNGLFFTQQHPVGKTIPVAMYIHLRHSFYLCIVLPHCSHPFLQAWVSRLPPTLTQTAM